MEMKTVISGSFRKHLDEIGKALVNFKKARVRVLAPATKDTLNEKADFVLLSTDDPKKSADVLEKEFMLNIEKVDFLYVANVGGYVGKSVATEMCFAITHGIPIVAAEEIKEFSNEIPLPIQNFLKRAVFKCLPIDSINTLTVAQLDLSNFFPIDLSSDQRRELDLIIDNLLEELRRVKIEI